MYDPTDEKVDELFTLLVSLIRDIPDTIAKQSLARLFEETALYQFLAARAGAPLGAQALESALAEHWDEIESRRNELAADALNAIQTQEF
jgi:hypothetical protein